MICLFTDYGHEGPYLGQVETVLLNLVPGEVIINLMADVPRNNPKSGAYLLASLTKYIPENSVVFSVVDPGVGTGKDEPVALRVNHRWYVGPDNGLLDLICRNAVVEKSIRITWRPDNISNSFHGRDLYAPVCTMIVKGEFEFGDDFKWQDNHEWPEDLGEIIYADRFGNCMTGIRAGTVSHDAGIKVGSQITSYAPTFGEIEPGRPFWYENSIGRVEVSVNRGSAAELMNAGVGDPVQVISV
ncbi:MAG: SAM-dependent chlorinase/fluorinase [Gammaproteobacteria bacterium]|nr:SAM-dependent chlorinase/fluorinase [Gammaproteobacteria bacterium]